LAIPVNDRRYRLTHRALPLLGVLAGVALVVGVVIGATRVSGAQKVGRTFALAWQQGDYRAMHDLLGDDAKRRYPLAAFEAAYRRADSTATATVLDVGKPQGLHGGSVRIPVTVRTRVFGRLRLPLSLPVSGEHVDWTPSQAFPGLQQGEVLSRHSVVPRRATILSVDRKVMAQGPAGARTSPLGALASSIAGTVEPSDDAIVQQDLYAHGFPRRAPTGKSGLERVFETRVRGVPGGTLLAGRRVLARARARPATKVHSTIDTRLQESAVTALAGRLGGIAAMDPRTGQVRALAGIAFSAPQPPGSTFKIVTTTAALEAHAVKPSDEFPVESKAVIDGVDLANANNESCGGTFAESFAHSCNSVFAPLGVKVGAKRLVATAERFGWNEAQTLPGAQPSTLPDAAAITTPLEVGSSAIGQYKTLATPLEMASVAQTIANGGVRVRPTLTPGAARAGSRVTSRTVSGTIRGLMLGVVKYGTGTSAAIPGVQVAGKTGTAELGDTRGPQADQTSNPDNTDAWFTSFAPAFKPRIVVAVLLVRQGAGGSTAAPAARIVLGRALGK
jgi:peptidoglycan glycosyltransferase